MQFIWPQFIGPQPTNSLTLSPLILLANLFLLLGRKVIHDIESLSNLFNRFAFLSRSYLI
jgi:hypothetical protein